MAKLANKMYTIGKIINLVIIAASLVVFILGLVFDLSPSSISVGGSSTAGEIKDDGLTMLLAGGIPLVVSFVVFLLALKAQSTFNNGVKNIAPHIVMIIIGAVGWNFFYTLGGVFGINAEYSEEER